MLKELKFLLTHRKDIKLLFKEIREVRDSVKKANRDGKIDKAELLDILRNADDVLEKITDMVEKS